MKTTHCRFLCVSFSADALMKASLLLSLSLFLAINANLRAVDPIGKSQKLASPDEVPEGLAKSDWSSIRAAYEAGRHAFMPVEGGWQARNPGQQWTTKFDGRGFIAQPRGAEWQWGLELKGYGFAGHERVVGGANRKSAVKAAGQRLTYGWDDTVQEWFVNDARGLEHGFTVRERRAANPQFAICNPQSELSFTLAVRGTLTPKVTADAQGVLFQDAAGATVLNYTGLKVWDADGKILPSRFILDAPEPSTIHHPPSILRLLVDERGARYPLTIDPIAQQAYLKPAAVGSTQQSDNFGFAVAVSGDTVVVGAYGEDSSTTGVNSTPNDDGTATQSGAAYVFVRSGTTWTQQAYLKPAAVGTTQLLDQFGWSVAVSGDTVAVGANGERSNTTGVNSTPNEDGFGAGAAYVFVRSGTTWTQQAYLKPAAVGTTQVFDEFGTSVAVSGDTVIVGARNEDSNTTGVNSTPNELASGAGAAYVFVRSGATWSQQAYLKPAAVGTTQQGDSFGWSVAVWGDTAVVGAFLEDSTSTGVNSTPNESVGAGACGAAYVFARSGTTWTQQAYLKPAAVGTTQQADSFGRSVAVSGNTVVVGAPEEDSSTTGVNSTPNDDGTAIQSGAAYVFTRSGITWTQQAFLKPAVVGTTQQGDSFGWSVAVSGDTLVVGAYFEDSNSIGVNSTPNEGSVESGAAYVFTRSATTWTQLAYLKPAAIGTTQAADQLGTSVAVSGDTVVVGAIGEDSGTTGVNSTPNENVGASGAAYIYTGLGSSGGGLPAPISSSGGDVVTGGGAPGATGADSGTDFDVLKRGGFLAENGMLVFPGNLLVGLGGVTATTSMGLWKKGIGNLSLLARSGNVAPEAGGATFDVLPVAPAINDSGEVTFLASLLVGSGAPAATADTDTGLWSELGSTGLGILMREGDPVPPIPGVFVSSCGSGAYATAHTGATTGEAVFSITMKGGVTEDTDTAILRASITGPAVTAVQVVARESDAMPGVAGEFFGPLASSYSDPAHMDAAGNVVFGALTKTNKESIWYQPVAPAGGPPAKVFIAGDTAPGTGGATFKSIKSATIGSTGMITFRGFLNSDGDNATNLRNDGIWRGTVGGGFTSILRRGDSGLPGMAVGAKVGNLWHSWLTNGNRGAWLGWLDVNGDGSSSAAAGDVSAIYTDLSGTMSLLIKAGDAAPGVAGATMASFDLPIVGGVQQGVFLGKLTLGGAITGANNGGIWRTAANGGPLVLLLRTGDTMTTTQGVKTVQKIDFPGSNSTQRRWEQPVMDATGRVLLFVTFTDGSTTEVLAP